MPPAVISAETVVRRADTVLSSTLDEGVVLMDIVRGAYYAFEHTSARFWQLTEQPISLQAVCERLVDEYDIEPASCMAEVVAFATTLCELDMLQVV